MKTIVLASNNAHKLKEYVSILKDYKIITLKDISYFEDIAETGNSFEENAIIKAKTISEYLKSKNKELLVISEDSGLCVDSLNGEPGIYSARYANGIHGDDTKNRSKLLEKLDGKDRSAYFICTIALYYPNGEYKIFVGKTYGKITEKECGRKDFGYDPIFYSDDLHKTFGEAKEDEKNMVSHRRRAIDKMLRYMEEA